MGIHVVGMHRSGTSMLSRIVGVLVGFDGTSEPTLGNEAGQWENPSIRSALDHLLHDANATWDAPPPVNITELSTSLRRQSVKRLERVSARLGSSLWVLKDPRTCLMLGYLSDRCPGQDTYVHTFRHPFEVAASLQQRNGFPLDLGLALWERYLWGQLHEAALLDSSYWIADASLISSIGRSHVAKLADWLRSQGIAISYAAELLACDTIRVELRTPHDPRRMPPLSPTQSSLVSLARALAAVGGPTGVSVSDIPQMSEASLQIIDDHRPVALRRRRLRALRRRFYRVDPALYPSPLSAWPNRR
jgi:hypothetical protein